ncbi:MAG: hypothetical protein LBE82_09255 [Chitinophagaceae bacterium]|jgi:hypothetical protein|nr:hypothetical protein [Chitinophagaceae bacterium]
MLRDENIRQKQSAKPTKYRNRYRIAVINDDTLEERYSMHITKRSAYTLISTFIVILVGLTLALLTLTPIKYYLPGAADIKTQAETRADFQRLKIRTDSLEQALGYKDRYLNDLKKVLDSTSSQPLDTASLHIPKTELSTE